MTLVKANTIDHLWQGNHEVKEINGKRYCIVFIGLFLSRSFGYFLSTLLLWRSFNHCSQTQQWHFSSGVQLHDEEEFIYFSRTTPYL